MYSLNGCDQLSYLHIAQSIHYSSISFFVSVYGRQKEGWMVELPPFIIKYWSPYTHVRAEPFLPLKTQLMQILWGYNNLQCVHLMLPAPLQCCNDYYVAEITGFSFLRKCSPALILFHVWS